MPHGHRPATESLTASTFRPQAWCACWSPTGGSELSIRQQLRLERFRGFKSSSTSSTPSVFYGSKNGSLLVTSRPPVLLGIPNLQGLATVAASHRRKLIRHRCGFQTSSQPWAGLLPRSSLPAGVERISVSKLRKILPSTPREDKEKYNRLVEQPLRKIQESVDRLPRREAMYQEVADAWRQDMNNMALRKFHDVTISPLEQRLKRYQLGIESSRHSIILHKAKILKRLMEQEVAPLEKRFEQLRSGIENCRQMWQSLLSQIQQSQTDFVPQLRRLHESYRRLKGDDTASKARDEGSHKKIHFRINNATREGVSDLLSQPGLVKIKMEAGPKATNRLLSQLWELRHTIRAADDDIQREGHRLRSLELMVALTQPDLPEIFAYHTAYYILAHLLEDLKFNAERMTSDVLQMSAYDELALFLVRSQGTVGNTQLLWSEKCRCLASDIARLVQKVSKTTDEMRVVYITTFHEGLSPLLQKRQTPLIKAQISEMRPIYSNLTDLKTLLRELRELRNICIESPELHSQDLLERIAAKHDALYVYARDFHKSISYANIWMTAANMYFGVSKPVRRTSRLLYFEGVDTERQILSEADMTMSLKDDVMVPPTAPPRWLRDISLYPQTKSIGIDFVTSFQTAAQVLADFRDCELVSVDILASADNFRSGIEYLTLAKQDRVAIFNLAVLTKRILNDSLPTLNHILSTRSILKVGVNMKLLKHTLAKELLIDLNGYANLAGHESFHAKWSDRTDKNHSTLSKLAKQYLGSTLESQGNLRDLMNLGLSQYSLGRNEHAWQIFHYLATRAYIPYQLARRKIVATAKHVRRTQDSGVCNRPDDPAFGDTETAGFGPVEVDAQFGRWYPTLGMSIWNYPNRYKGRKNYLRALTSQMASVTLKSHRYFGTPMQHTREKYANQLQAYYLATAFFERLNAIRSYFPSQRNVAASILDIADKAKLPLNDWHRQALEADAAKMGHPVPAVLRSSSATEIGKVDKLSMIPNQDRVLEAEKRVEVLLSQHERLRVELKKRDFRRGRKSLLTFVLHEDYGLNTTKIAEVLKLSTDEIHSDLFSSAVYIHENRLQFSSRERRKINRMFRRVQNLVRDSTAAETKDPREWYREHDVLLRPKDHALLQDLHRANEEVPVSSTSLPKKMAIVGFSSVADDDASGEEQSQILEIETERSLAKAPHVGGFNRPPSSRPKTAKVATDAVVSRKRSRLRGLPSKASAKTRRDASTLTGTATTQQRVNKSKHTKLIISTRSVTNTASRLVKSKLPKKLTSTTKKNGKSKRPHRSQTA